MRHERGIVVGKRGWNLGLPSPFSDVIMIDVAMLTEKKNIEDNSFTCKLWRRNCN